ncbi:FadR/GntR family transcriptional regulator [Streptomyces sp. NPDC004096]|uniref:FadR/GntR family transcriptional regulator n=1 Tax=unclassified Streptomyces TaxID=2593676 RepID=UPI0033AB4985
MPIQPTERASLVAQVIGQLQNLIESGEWPVGTRIPAEPVLTETLGVGRNTVREAVRALVHTGMLQTRQGDGTYVRASDSLGAALRRRLHRAGLMETQEVRSALERDAARLAARRRTDADLQVLRSALADRTTAWEAADVEAFVQADLAFHRAVVAAAYNGMLSDIYSHLTDGLYALISSMTDSSLPDRDRTHFASHADLLAAIEASDPHAAGRAVARYIDDGTSALRLLQDADPLPSAAPPSAAAPPPRTGTLTGDE